MFLLSSFVSSLTDPRAVPPPVREFVEKVRSGGDVDSFSETLRLIDEHYEYFEVPFENGSLLNKPNENTGSAKVFRYILLLSQISRQILFYDCVLLM